MGGVKAWFYIDKLDIPRLDGATLAGKSVVGEVVNLAAKRYVYYGYVDGKVSLIVEPDHTTNGD